MNKMKFYLIAFLLLMPVIALTAPVQSSGEASTTFIPDEETDTFRVRIESSQWEFKAYDMILAEQKNVDLDTASDDVKADYEVKHRIEMPSATDESTIEFHLYSRDVQHGFSINELDLAIALKRPVPGDEFGEVTVEERSLEGIVELADGETGENGQGVTYSSFCHIFCGLGHPDMKLKFVIGGGAIELGPVVFYAAVFINLSIAGLTIRSIVSKLELVPSETPAQN